MYRKRRKIRYYNGPVSHERLRDKPWFLYVVIALVALGVALILGSVLDGVADRTGGKLYERKNLHDFGGVDAWEKYGALPSVDADFLSLFGLDNGDIRGELSDLEFGDGVTVLLYDGNGDVYYASELPSSTSLSLGRRSSVTLSTLAQRAEDKGKTSVGVFVSGAFAEKEQADRILGRAKELAILSEIASSGLDEILIVGLPVHQELAAEIHAYLRDVSELLNGKMRLGVAVDGELNAADIARVVAASAEYADRLVLDLCGCSNEALTAAIEKNAYYLTYYKMCVMFTEREQYEIVSSYGVSGSLRFEKNP